MNEQQRISEKQRNRRLAVWGLLGLVPVPAMGVLFGLVLFPGTFGQIVFGFSKLWILLFPAIWVRWVEGQAWSFPRWRRGSVFWGGIAGIFLGGVIFAAYMLIGQHWIDAALVGDQMREIGLRDSRTFIVMALYWCFVNSLLEEYVWRWFVYRKCEQWLTAHGAVLLSAALFTIHHVLALTIYLDWKMNLLASAGVFLGGCIWSGLYLRFRSVWPGYISHFFADAVIFGLAWRLLLGG